MPRTPDTPADPGVADAEHPSRHRAIRPSPWRTRHPTRPRWAAPPRRAARRDPATAVRRRTPPGTRRPSSARRALPAIPAWAVVPSRRRRPTGRETTRRERQTSPVAVALPDAGSYALLPTRASPRPMAVRHVSCSAGMSPSGANRRGSGPRTWTCTPRGRPWATAGRTSTRGRRVRVPPHGLCPAPHRPGRRIRHRARRQGVQEGNRQRRKSSAATNSSRVGRRGRG